MPAYRKTTRDEASDQYVSATTPLPRGELMHELETIKDSVEMAYVLIKSKGKNRKNEGYQCALKKAQVEYLALNAFREVLRKRQSKYGKVISWLDEQISHLSAKNGESFARMSGIVSSKT
jgi:hypothetical protein